ncbi:MAG: hypothetical protein HY787_06720 [Deltaproteobacteria bacterium]|nr:hypothetical protein [Deltaproteobacteria bacterium]
MKPNIKRIIAREGLIIISIILLAGISFFLDLRLSSHKGLYEANVQEIEPVIHNDPLGLLGKIPQGIILRFPKNTKDDVIKQTIKRNFPNIKGDDWIVWDSPKGENINASYDNKGNHVFTSVIYRIGWSYLYLFCRIRVFHGYPQDVVVIEV